MRTHQAIFGGIYPGVMPVSAVGTAFTKTTGFANRAFKEKGGTSRPMPSFRCVDLSGAGPSILRYDDVFLAAPTGDFE